jgi:hypothetical protein
MRKARAASSMLSWTQHDARTSGVGEGCVWRGELELVNLMTQVMVV